ncbi:alpha-1,2-fucosyltransferase [Crateriforma conspicua]|uniref:Glycosyl transferase family 11 n=1 Tax=Crateriforma conspicua TaxID=2527996 RepID=A0A5C5YDZ0_9PLAN|nr:alpha-1,2-fucosyltransferase [Crateriforma conspicua]QDV61233.1 hypothetical protein Mal65_03560 [Crateriforma conspicua]TWT72515.1 hypothetical protein Pan14r_48350 [Crateriforma conspicua]
MILIGKRPGRLGNGLNLFAHFIAFSVQHDCPLANPAFFEYAHLFEGTYRSGLACRFPAQPASMVPSPWVRNVAYRGLHVVLASLNDTGMVRWPLRIHSIDLTKDCDLESEDFLRRVRDGNLIVRGYRFRCPNLVRRHINVIRDFFRPVEIYRRQIDASLQVARDGCDVLIGTHIRQTDYQKFMNGDWFYPVARYHAWMRDLANQFPGRRVRFLVCSDGNLSAEDFPEVDVTINRGSPVVDMYSLAGCDYLIGPPSSFSGWASMYGDVPLRVLYPHDRHIGRHEFCVSGDVDFSTTAAAA